MSILSEGSDIDDPVYDDEDDDEDDDYDYSSFDRKFQAFVGFYCKCGAGQLKQGCKAPNKTMADMSIDYENDAEDYLCEENDEEMSENTQSDEDLIYDNTDDPEESDMIKR